MLQVTLIFKAVHKPCSQQKLAHLVVIFCILNNVNKFLSCLDLILSKKKKVRDIFCLHTKLSQSDDYSAHC